MDNGDAKLLANGRIEFGFQDEAVPERVQKPGHGHGGFGVLAFAIETNEEVACDPESGHGI